MGGLVLHSSSSDYRNAGPVVVIMETLIQPAALSYLPQHFLCELVGSEFFQGLCPSRYCDGLAPAVGLADRGTHSRQPRFAAFGHIEKRYCGDGGVNGGGGGREPSFVLLECLSVCCLDV